MADEVWLDILPSMRGFETLLGKGADKAAKSAGAKSSKEFSKAFEGGADGASDALVKELEAGQKQSAALVSKLTGQISTARQAQKRSAADLLTAEQRLADAQAKYGDDSKQAQAATLRLEAAREKAGDATRKFEQAENALKEGQRSHKTVTEQLTKAQSDLGTETKKAPGLWGKLGDSLGAAGGKAKSFSKSVGGLATQLAGAVGGVALMQEAFGQGLEKETSVDKLNAALAATPKQAETYGAAAGNLYSQAYGENMEEVSTSVDAVVSSFAGMRNASQADIEKITGYAMNLAKTFDVDVAESTATAGTLMKSGLAKDATQAMDLITGAMTKVPQQMRGEVLPVMSEYSKHFAALGIDGETAMGMITAASGDGAIGMDKMGDALKEFTIRGTDMSKTTSGAYEALGLNTKTITNELLAGGDSAEGAMAKIVHGLQGIEDPGQQAAAAISLFGTPLEDLGTDQIPNFLGMIDPMGDAFDSTAGSADKLGKTLSDNTSNSIETTKRSFMGMLTEGIEPLLGPAKWFFDWATNTPGLMHAVVAVLGVAAVALGVMAVQTAAVTIAASPWIAVVGLIALAIGGVVLAIANWGTIMQWAGDVIGTAMSWIGGKWAEFQALWSSGMATVSQWWKDLWGGAKNYVVSKFTETVLWVLGKWTAFREAWSAGMAAVSQWWKDLWGGAKNFVVTKFTETVLWVLGKWLAFRTSWNNGITAVRNWWTGLWGGVKDFVVTKFTETVSWVLGKWLAFRTSWNNGITAVRNWWTGLWDGVGSKLSAVWNNRIKPILQILGSFIRDHVAPVFKKGVDKIASLWDGIKSFAKKPIKFVIDTVINKGLIGAFNKVAGWIPGVNTLDPIKVPGFARGGWTGPGSKFEEAGVVHADEFVIRKESQRDISRKAPGLLDAFNRFGSRALGYATGGLVHPMDPSHRAVSAGWHGYKGHVGTDYPAPVGTLVHSPGPGVVSQTGWNLPGGTGKQVWISHTNGLMSRVHHLAQWLVKAGQKVTAGQAIGKVGMTGNTTGPHAHWGVMDGSRYLNPATVWGSGIGGSGDFYSGGGGGFSLSAFTDLAKSLGSQFTKHFPGGGMLTDLTKGIGSKAIQSAKDWLASKWDAIKDFGGNIISRGKNALGIGNVKDQVRGVANGYGWGTGLEWDALSNIISRESGWDPNAANPNSSARGLFQKMTSIHGAIEGTAGDQAGWGLNYIKSRYGDPINAWAHWQRNNSYDGGGLVDKPAYLYDQGGIIPPGATTVVNKTRQPEVVYTKSQSDALTALAERVANGGGEQISITVPDRATAKDYLDAIRFERRRMSRSH